MYRRLEFGVCPVCGTRHFIDLRQNNYTGEEKFKHYKNRVAELKLKEWQNKIANSIQGTQAKQYFYYGTFQRHKDTWKTYRTNFNNEKELIFNQKTKSVI